MVYKGDNLDSFESAFKEEFKRLKNLAVFEVNREENIEFSKVCDINIKAYNKLMEERENKREEIEKQCLDQTVDKAQKLAKEEKCQKDKADQDNANQDKVTQDNADQDKDANQDNADQDKANKDNANQDKANKDKVNKDKAVKDKEVKGNVISISSAIEATGEIVKTINDIRISINQRKRLDIRDIKKQLEYWKKLKNIDFLLNEIDNVKKNTKELFCILVSQKFEDNDKTIDTFTVKAISRI